MDGRSTWPDAAWMPRARRHEAGVHSGPGGRGAAVNTAARAGRPCDDFLSVAAARLRPRSRPRFPPWMILGGVRGRAALSLSWLSPLGDLRAALLSPLDDLVAAVVSPFLGGRMFTIGTCRGGRIVLAWILLVVEKGCVGCATLVDACSRCTGLQRPACYWLATCTAHKNPA